MTVEEYAVHIVHVTAQLCLSCMCPSVVFNYTEKGDEKS